MSPILGVAQAGTSTNREATASNVVPQRLLVLGGGVVGEVWVRRLEACEQPWGARRLQHPAISLPDSAEPAAGLRRQKLQPMR